VAEDFDELLDRSHALRERLDLLENRANSIMFPRLPSATRRVPASPVPSPPSVTPPPAKTRPKPVPPQPVTQGTSKLLSYPVRPLVFSYGGDAVSLPDLAPLANAFVELSGETYALSDLFAPEGSPVSLSPEDLFGISEIVLHFLKSEGYEGIVAFPDPTQIDPPTGRDLRSPGKTRLDFKVWVARIHSVAVEHHSAGGNGSKRKRNWEEDLGKRMWSRRVLGQPLNGSFRRIVERMGEHPGRSSRMLLMPSDRPGEIEAVVELKEEERARFGLHASNTGSESTGEWLLGGYFRHFQATNADDELEVSWTTSSSFERHVFGLGYVLPLLSLDVLDLTFRLGHARYDASTFALAQIDFEGDTTSVDVGLRLSPLAWENDDYRFDAFAGLAYDRSRAYNSLSAKEGRAGFVSPRIGLSVRGKGSIVRSLSAITLSGNLHSIPEDQRRLMGGADVEDRVAEIGFSHAGLVNLGEWLSSSSSTSFAPADSHLAFFRFNTQLGLGSARRLPHRQIIMGGMQTVRGYPEAVAAGDYGFSTSLEYRWKFLQRGSPGRGFSLSLAPFFDFGATYVNDPKVFESDQYLAGIGLGLAMELPRGGSARLDLAKPLKEVVRAGNLIAGTGSDDVRLHASTQWEF
jgi:hemolysin activation/secretion protein